MRGCKISKFLPRFHFFDSCRVSPSADWRLIGSPGGCRVPQWASCSFTCSTTRTFLTSTTTSPRVSTTATWHRYLVSASLIGISYSVSMRMAVHARCMGLSNRKNTLYSCSRARVSNAGFDSLGQSLRALRAPQGIGQNIQGQRQGFRPWDNLNFGKMAPGQCPKSTWL